MGSRLAGKVALVTAAGQGIGRASALAMAAAGARVIATDINARSLAALAAEGVETRHLNVRDTAAVTAMAADLPDVNVLFNCAGVMAGGTILDCTEEDWAFALDVNLTSMLRTCRAFLPGMIRAGGGSVINMGSVIGGQVAASRQFLQGATKAGVVGLTRSIAADFAGQGIRCNAICPGAIDSPALEDSLHAGRRGDAAAREAARAALVARQPMGRIGRPEEVAQLVVHLASDESSYTTGAVHVIDGGWSNV